MCVTWCGLLLLFVVMLCLLSCDREMKNKDKGKMTREQSDTLTPNKSISHREVGVQDNPCMAIVVIAEASGQEGITSVLGKLVPVVDNMVGKVGEIEVRFVRLEDETHEQNTQQGAVLTTLTYLEKNAKSKHSYRHVRQVANDVEVVDSDNDNKTQKKKWGNRRQGML